MPWTIKHHDYYQKQEAWSGTVNLACYVYRRAKADESTEMEIEINKFEKHMIRTKGKAYHRTYFNKMVKQLEEISNGAVLILRYYGHGVYKILVRPISFAIENGKAKAETSIGQGNGNPMFSEEHKKRLLEQQQQDIETIKSLFDKLGMRWSREALLKIWHMAEKSVDNVKDAIDFMLHANTTQSEPIRNAFGWFIKCLQRGEYKLFAHQLLYKLPRFNSKIELMGYITSHLYGDPVPIDPNIGSRLEYEASYSKADQKNSLPASS
jgi:hypothetical protein